MKKYAGIGLFVFPILLLLTVLSIQQYRKNKPFHHSSGTFKTDQIGDRSVLRTLSCYLEHEPFPNQLSIDYWVVGSTGTEKGTTIYILQYDRSAKTLTKFARFPPHRLDQPPKMLEHWRNVEEAVVHAVTNESRQVKTIWELENFNGGDLENLKEFGARRQ